MSKKHFIALADVIRYENAYGNTPFACTQLIALADFCKAQNPKFNRERWYAYIRGECGTNGGVRKS